MAKFYGPVGYVESRETTPGVWEDVVTESNYSGDVIKSTGRWQEGDKLTDDIVINNVISIVADTFAYMNFPMMRYIKWMGAYWKITGIDVQSPRLILTIGGVYNGKKA